MRLLKSGTALLVTGLVGGAGISSPTAAVEARILTDFETLYRDARDEPLRLRGPDDPDQQLDTRLALELSGQGLYARPEWQQTGSEAGELSLPEIYYDASAGALELSIGRKALQWDYGFSAAPVSWLGPPEQQDHYSADPLVLAEYYRGLQVWQAGCTVRLEDADELCLVRTEGFTGPADWQLLAGYETGWRLGAGVNWIAADRLAIRASAAWAERRKSPAYDPADPETAYQTQDPIRTERGERLEWLLGTSLSLDSGWEFLLEHAWDSAALSAEDWRQIMARVADLTTTPEPQPGARPQNLGWLAGAAATRPPVQHRTLLRATQSWNDWSGEGLVTLLWTDDQPTWVSEIGPSYQWTEQARLKARWRHYDADGILADLGNEFRLILEIRTARR